MPRPRSPRRIASRPVVPLFKPGGIRAAAQVRLREDEFEALRLADVEGLQQGAAAARMAVSRQTFGRVLASARRNVARALVFGLALRIDGPRDSAREGLPLHTCGADGQACARCAQQQHLVQLRVRGPRPPSRA